ncbi:MAG: DUF4328 domain-containing protein [Ignavibacteriae bacterium]|nr:DUF4328 domain-containing protein [Ignavibacteriota bacterium]MCB9216230.1 DUF4328 domain-containing protein [Ignavibacteria bacterium]
MPLENHIALKNSFSFAKLTRILTGALVAFAVLSVLLIPIQFDLYSKLGSVAEDGYGWDSALDAADNLNIIGQIVLAGMFSIAAITFLTWFYRARKNVDVLEVEGVGYSHGATVGWWFVPFANLVTPYRVAKEIWIASNPATYEPGNSTLWLKDDEAKPVKTWWTFWLIFIIVERMADRVYADPESFAVYREKLVVDMVVNLLAVIAVWFALKFIKALYRRQEERYSVIYEQSVKANGGEGGSELLSA